MANHITLDLYQAEEALSYINADLPFKQWSKIGRALYSEFGEDARDVFEDWSATGSSYHKKEFHAWWKNFRKTKKTSFGSFIYEAMEADWVPERKEYTAEEKQAFKKEQAARKAAANEKRIEAEETQWQALEKEEVLFNSWPKNFAPTQYMLKKQMADISRFVDVRLGKDKHNNNCLVWPIYEELFNQGRFCGFERILDKGFKIGDKLINKLSSDAAFTDVGFCTFGKCDRGNMPERIFVVGGFADAFSAHLSSNEIIITAIGEGNIPDLINRLSEKYPEIQFIAAPDNDKAGWDIIERSGGFWTLPQQDGSDWSDVYINEGSEALVSQLLNVRGFKTINSNSRYLKASIQRGLNLLNSGMGTGKSTNIHEFVKENSHLKTLIISHRVALAKSLKSGLAEKDISVEFYQDLIPKDPTPNDDQNFALRNAHILVCSVDSLHRLAGATWDVVFVDEIEQNLGQYFAKTIQYGEHCLNYLTFVLTTSKYQILADAHLGDLTFDFCNFIGLHSGIVYNNEFKIAEGKRLFVYESKDHLMEVVMQQVMSKDKRYIYANSKEQVKTIATAIEQERERKHYSGSVLVVHADVTGTEEVQTALENINAVVPQLDVLIASPTLGTGFDIKPFEIKDGKSEGHLFNSVTGFLTSNVGTAEEGHQGLNRAREVQEFHVYLDSAERSEPTDPTYIQDKLIEQVSAETMALLEIDPSTGDWTSRNPLFEWLYCKVKAHKNESRNRYKAKFLELAKRDGYDIQYISKNDLTAKFGAEVREQAKERNNRLSLKEVLNAKVHVGDAFSYMMKNGDDFTQAEIDKSKVVFDLHLDAANDKQLECLKPFAKEVFEEFAHEGENAHLNDADNAIELPESIKEAVITALTYKQSKNRHVDAIKKLAWVNVNHQTAAVLDRKDVNHAESRVSWRHISIKRAHLIKLLQAAGIDENLNYNGKRWVKDELSGQMSAWLRKKETQDRLFKYSNITVTQKTIEDPVKWLNSHLRSFGVPIESGKKRVNGKPVNVYFVDEAAWEGVRTLVALRSEGIEQGNEIETMSESVLTKVTTDFINDISGENPSIKPGYNVLFNKLDNQCMLLGMVDLRDELGAAFAQIAHHFDDNRTQKSDPHGAVVINKQIAQCGSPIQPQQPSCDKGSQGVEGGEEQTPLEFPKNTLSNLSMDHVELVNEVAAIAINTHKLPRHKVLETMLAYELRNITGSAEAWAGSVKQAVEECL